MSGRSDGSGVCQEIFLGFGAPHSVVLFDDAGKLSVELVVLTKLRKVGKGDKRHGNEVVDQLLATGDLIKIQHRVHHGIEATNVGDHGGGIEAAVIHHFDRLDHIVGIAARVAANVGEAVMHVVKVEHGGEVMVGRACKEVQAPVKAQHAIGELHNGLYGGVNKRIVIPLAARKLHKMLTGIFHLVRVNVNESHAVFRGFLHRHDRGRARKAGIIDIRDNEQARLPIAMNGVIDSAEAHGACCRHKDRISALDDPHGVEMR